MCRTKNSPQKGTTPLGYCHTEEKFSYLRSLRPQHFCNIRLNIILSIRSSSANGCLTFGFSDWNCVHLLNSHARYVHSHYILIWISLIMLRENYKLLRFSRHNFSITLLINTFPATACSQMPSIYVFFSGSVFFICFILEAEDRNFFPCLLIDCCTPEQPKLLCWYFSRYSFNKSMYEILCSPAGWPSIDRPPGYPKPFSYRFTIFTHVFRGLFQSIQQIMG
jgi:hypothetical protein